MNENSRLKLKKFGLQGKKINLSYKMKFKGKKTKETSSLDFSLESSIKVN
jgi:hypothetical protein